MDSKESARPSSIRQPGTVVQFGGPIAEKSEEPPAQTGPDFLERWWVAIAAMILAGWGGLSYLIFTSTGWWGRGILLGLYALAVVAIVAIVRAGARNREVEITSATEEQPEEQQRAA